MAMPRAPHGRRAPKQGLLASLDALARGALPTVLTILAMVLAGGVAFMPGLIAATALPCVFFWSVFRPAAMPPPAVFGLGLLLDLLTATPLGIGILILLVVHGVARATRRFLARQGFLLVWLAFAGFALAAGLLGWVLQALLGWRLPPLAPGLWQVVLTIGLYPILAWPLGRLQAGLIDAEVTA
jgi:rod shape-determining protein MreD